MKMQMRSRKIVLEPKKRSAEVMEFERKLRASFVGQDEAVAQFVDIYQTVLAGLSMPGHPVSNLLFLGPTGSGKTRLVEAAAEIFFGSSSSMVKIDCGEFQHAHEIAKLLGSPPGYVGHLETSPLITQEILNRSHTEKLKLNFVLFDEIEKASETLWQLLLGILDKATLSLRDGRKVDLSRSIVFMTSNLGAVEMGRLVSGGIGFAPAFAAEQASEVERQIYRVAVDAAKRRFSPEFMNRIDKVLVFRTLRPEELRRILDMELEGVRRRIVSTRPNFSIGIAYTEDARGFLLKEGSNAKYGARHIKRAIERHVVAPLSSLFATGQVQTSDRLEVGMSPEGTALIFTKEEVLVKPRSGSVGGSYRSTHNGGEYYSGSGFSMSAFALN